LEDVNTDITPDMDYVDTDFGFPAAVTIQMMIDDEYGVKVDIKQLSGFKSLNELYQFVEEQKVMEAFIKHISIIYLQVDYLMMKLLIGFQNGIVRKSFKIGVKTEI
jgi:acyl carrier protein